MCGASSLGDKEKKSTIQLTTWFMVSLLRSAGRQRCCVRQRTSIRSDARSFSSQLLHFIFIWSDVSCGAHWHSTNQHWRLPGVKSIPIRGVHAMRRQQFLTFFILSILCAMCVLYIFSVWDSLHRGWNDESDGIQKRHLGSTHLVQKRDKSMWIPSQFQYI